MTNRINFFNNVPSAPQLEQEQVNAAKEVEERRQANGYKTSHNRQKAKRRAFAEGAIKSCGISLGADERT